tara:strand:- start:206 stop:1303 length:1098 start_codon:yes stop_codon:yes gene_type:complete
MNFILDKLKKDMNLDEIIKFLDQLELNYKINDNLIIIKYPKKLKFSEHKYIRDTRGLIFDIKNKKIINRSFSGCISYNNFKNNIDWDNVVLEEFIDGTLINLYYNEEWKLSTKFCIDAKTSFYRSKKSYYDLFNEIYSLDNIDFDKKYTYSFVLVHNESRNISKISENKIYHIETTNNYTGEKINLDLGFTKPKILKIKNIINQYNLNSYTDLENFKFNSWNNPGFMIYNLDRTQRTVFKNKDFTEIENLIKGQKDFNFIFIKYLKNRPIIDKLLNVFPEYNELFKKIYNKFTSLILEIFDIYCNTKVYKTQKLVDRKFKKIIYDIHGIYLQKVKKEKKFKIALKDVYELLLNYDSAYLYSTYFN